MSPNNEKRNSWNKYVIFLTAKSTYSSPDSKVNMGCFGIDSNMEYMDNNLKIIFPGSKAR